MSELPRYLRRPEAGAYLRQTFGFGSAKSLAALACRGLGPAYRRVGTGGPAVYEIQELTRWGEAQLSPPIVSPRDLATVADAEATAA